MQRLLIAAALCLLATGAKADFTGNELKGYCEYWPRQTDSTIMCMGYMIGSLDTIRGFNKTVFHGAQYCEPQGFTYDQLAAMLQKYLEDHPQNLQLAASSLILNMLTEAFPCQKK
jgi:hypothetical protein